LLFPNSVVAKCANSACGEPFLYFRSGKLYQFPRVRKTDENARVEAFWLCQDCARDFTLKWIDEGVRVVRRVEEAVLVQPSSPLTSDACVVTPLSNI